MNPDVALFYILKNDPDVSAIVQVGSDYQIYPLYRPQTYPMPAVVTQQINNNPSTSKDGPSTLDRYTYQISSIAENINAARGLAEKVRSALDFKSGTFDGVKVQYIGYQQGESVQWADGSKLEGACMLSQTYLIRIER